MRSSEKNIELFFVYLKMLKNIVDLFHKIDFGYCKNMNFYGK